MAKKTHIKDALLKLGLTLADEDETNLRFDANHSLNSLHEVFTAHGWDLTFNGSVGNGIRQAAYNESCFHGGRAVLHFQGESIYYVTLNFYVNYSD